MTIRQLEYVLKIARCNSISLAAKELFISQQALSESLKLLEDELQFTIFVRSKKGVKLTTEGKLLLQDIEKIISCIRSWDNLAKMQNGFKPIVIFVQNLLRDLIIIDDLKESIEMRGKFKIHWETNSIPQIMKKLSSNEPCIAILNFSPQSYIYPKIMHLKALNKCSVRCIVPEEDSKMQLIFRKDDFISTKEKISLDDLKGRRVVVNKGVEKSFALTQIVAASNNTAIILPSSVNAVDYILQRKNFFTCLPDYIARHNIHVMNGSVCSRKILEEIDQGNRCWLLSNENTDEEIDIIADEMAKYILN